jgi:ascorbate-specific PTS system EIIC-type component UlaA
MFVIIILSGQIYQIVATVTMSDSFYILYLLTNLKFMKLGPEFSNQVRNIGFIKLRKKLILFKDTILSQCVIYYICSTS